MLKANNKILVNLWESVHTRPYLYSSLAMLISAFFIGYSIKSSMPSKSLITRHRFTVLEKRIKHLSADKNISNLSLNNLPHLENESDSILDGWGNRIILKHSLNNSFILISFGEDGVKDGKADLSYKIKLDK